MNIAHLFPTRSPGTVKLAHGQRQPTAKGIRPGQGVINLKMAEAYVTISRKEIIFCGESGMKITKEEVEHVSLLARLKFSETEKERFTTQLNTILEYMDQLEKVDTTGVEPTFHAVARTNVFREDDVQPSISQELSLSNSPDRDRGFFRVPKIIE